jgi:hypothetical protein
VTNSVSLPSSCCMQYIFSHLTQNNTSFLHDRWKYIPHHSPAPRLKTLELFVIYLPESSGFTNHKKPYSKCSIPLVSSLNLSQICWKNFFLLNAAFSMNLQIYCQFMVHVALFVLGLHCTFHILRLTHGAVYKYRAFEYVWPKITALFLKIFTNFPSTSLEVN